MADKSINPNDTWLGTLRTYNEWGPAHTIAIDPALQVTSIEEISAFIRNDWVFEIKTVGESEKGSD